MDSDHINQAQSMKGKNFHRYTKTRLRLHADGWFANVLRVESPNCDDRPPALFVAGDKRRLLLHQGECKTVVIPKIDLIVLHAISLPPGEFGTRHVVRLFTNCLNKKSHPSFRELSNLRVSPHFFIDRQGRLMQLVSIFKRAWHAGQSAFQGRTACNDFSVGIELEGTDNTAFTRAQYQVTVRLIKSLFKIWPHLYHEHIVGHCHIAPDRKTDPGSCFRWQYLFKKMTVKKF